jgi:uncharacterized protein (DUF1501 family)
MDLHNTASHSRRAFLRRTSQLALSGVALPTALNLAAIGEAAAFNATDYKALVCVFLYGGNDYANTVVTYDDASYDLYSTVRSGGANRTAGGIALGQADLTPTLLTPTTALPGGRQYALNPTMTGLTNLFNTGKAAVQLNVGPLIAPLTRVEYDKKSKLIPPKLFSHNDQQSTWQSLAPEGTTEGWGGHLGDLAMQSNANTQSLFTCMSVTGNAVLLSGTNALAYQINSSGPVRINALNNWVYNSSAVRDAIKLITQEPSSHELEDAYRSIIKRGVDSADTLTNALATVTLATVFPNGNSLADQLKMVAKLIAARSTLGTKRQVFMVSIGGFDLHDNLNNQHPALLGKVSEAMTAFYNATTELGVADKVTAFTASDFGRTLSSNGDGTDHGWGSHHLVVGGAVKGKAFYGKAPPVSVANTNAAEDQWHVGQGRLLPSTSVDQYVATLARWFGVSDAELPGLLPNLANFGGTDYPTNLGFMK